MTFDERFTNWIYWCSGRVVLPAVRAISAEAAWSGPQGKGCPTGWGDYDITSLPPRPIRPRVDPHDALDLQRAYVRLPAWDRLAIKLIWFSPKLRDQEIARRLNTHHTRLQDAARAAREALRRRVDGVARQDR